LPWLYTELRTSLGNLVRLCLKIKIKNDWGCNSVVDHFPCILEALDPIPSTGKKEKEKGFL
jgi:hypothetical protein